MAEINNGNDMKVISFYLPQFHAIPENDHAHGKGFTEWTNTKKALPLYENHYQPRTPKDQNYYCLLDEQVMRDQSKLAKQYGVWGFCYYHYWFKGGKKLLEKPLENMLKDPQVDIPFCLSWANENWTKRWDGGNNEIIVAQDYGSEAEWALHFDYLLPFFRDPRYITVDGCPLFVIYKPELIPHIGKMIAFFQKKAKASGLKGLKIAVQFPVYYLEGYKRTFFDYFIEFEPQFTRSNRNEKMTIRTQVKRILLKMGCNQFVQKVNRTVKKPHSSAPSALQLTIRNYDRDWETIIQYRSDDPKMLYGGFVDWDNTPRNKFGLSYKEASPSKFGKYLTQQFRKIQQSNSLHVCFLNAWNEWAEGAYLEPDEKYGCAYLENLKNALENYDKI